MGELWVGVTGLFATDNPSPGLGVIRALRAADPSWRILALPYDRFHTGAFADDLIDAYAFLPYPSLGAPALLDRLRAITAEHPLDVVVPTVDAEQSHYLALRRSVRRLGIRTFLPSATALAARAKSRLPALGPHAGVAVPETVVLRSADAVGRIAERSHYPQILKGALVDSIVTYGPEDFRVAARELATQWGYPLLAQPLIEGEEYDVAGVARRGELLGTTAMKKLGVTSKGTAWAGVTVEEPSLVEATGELARALRWDGAFEVEFIRRADGRLFCFEINPRFPSWIALAAAAGANLPAALVRLAVGEDAERLAAAPGWLFTRTVRERVYARNPLVEERNAGPVDPRRNGTLRGAEKARRRGGRAVHPAPHAAWPPAAGRVVGAARSGTVAVTGLNAAENPSPGLTVASALRALPLPPRLIGLTHEVLSTGAYADRIWDEVRLLPFPSREERGYPEALLQACAEAGVDCLVPTLDIEIPIVTWLASRLAAAGVATLVPPPSALAAAAKLRLPRLAAHGFRIPRTLTISALDEMAGLTGELGRPYVLKGPYADARIVRADDEARVVARRLADTWGFPLLAQELITGEEYGIAAVADRRHRVVGSVVVRKEIRSANGNTWGGTALADRSLAALADRFAEAVGWVGPFELEVIRPAGRPAFLIEVNPRFPAWASLSAGAGINLPWLAVLLARGERPAAGVVGAGAFYVRMAWDAIGPVDRMGSLAVDRKLGGTA